MALFFGALLGGRVCAEARGSMKRRVWLFAVFLLGCEVTPVQPEKKRNPSPAPQRPLPPVTLPFLDVPPAPPVSVPVAVVPYGGFGVECRQLFQMTDALCVDPSIPASMRGSLCSAMQQSMDAIKRSPPSPQLESSCKQVREAIQPSLASLRSASLPAVP